MLPVNDNLTLVKPTAVYSSTNPSKITLPQPIIKLERTPSDLRKYLLKKSVEKYTNSWNNTMSAV